ncbi:MAG: efflux RND transporter periplasmic adaptor subunit [Candidatus Aminicenantes bacterium]|nr:efflux RND transporter periplasmic adaptor subunit [Candidatus Aminicenantes bacterium]
MHRKRIANNFIPVLMVLLLVFFTAGCGKKSEDKGKEKAPHGDTAKTDRGGHPGGDQKKMPGQDRAGKADRSKDGEKRGDRGRGGEEGKKEEKIDVDKLDIPDRMKEAIKSGRIPMERVKQYLEMQKGSANAPLVKIERVARKSLNSYLVLNGTVEPERLVKVYSRLSAYVKKLVQEEGAFVKKGSVLALLDDTEIRITHQQAKIQLEQAKLSLEEQKSTYDRSRELKKSEMISEQDYQTAEANYRNAKLEHDNKLENFKNLELQLSYTRIKSPAEGYVTERLLEVGDRVNTNQHVYTVEDFNPLLIKVYAPSSDALQLKEGLKAIVTSDILADRPFDGSVKLINPRIDVQTGTVKVTVEVYDKTENLKPGMFVEVKIIVGEKEDTIVIPRKSVTYKQDKTYVFVFKRMEVSKREIKVGITEEDQIEVLEGLNEGEAIVIVGVESLKDKSKVRVSR